MEQAKGKPKQASFSGKFSSGEHNNLRHPKPPGIPRSQSSKELQHTCKSNPHLRAGRRILFRSYSSPNIGSTTDLNPPKSTQSFHLGDRGKNGVFYAGFKGQKNTVKELPQVVGKRKTPLMVKEDAFFTTIEPFGKNSDMIEDTITDLHGQSTDEVNEDHVEREQNTLTSCKRHAVFFIDHDDGRLLSNTKLLPVLEEPEQETYDKSPWQFHGNDKSPWQFHGNESSISEMEEPVIVVTSDKSPWHCRDNEPRYHVVDELFESDDEGLVVKKRELIENRLDPIKNRLDPIKKAMIDSWILDVTLKTSKSNKKVTY